MSIPASYTEATLKAYLHAEVGNIASALGWSVDGGEYDEPVNDALLMYGESDIENIDSTEGVRKLRLLGLLAAWRKAASHLAGDYDFSADGASYSRSQAYAMAEKRVQALESQCAGFLPEYAVHTQQMDWSHDPYQEREYDDRTL